MTRIQHRLPWNAAETRSASIHQKYCFAYLRTTGEVRRNLCVRPNQCFPRLERLPFSNSIQPSTSIYYYSR